ADSGHGSKPGRSAGSGSRRVRLGKHGKRREHERGREKCEFSNHSGYYSFFIQSVSLTGGGCVPRRGTGGLTRKTVSGGEAGIFWGLPSLVLLSDRAGHVDH